MNDLGLDATDTGDHGGAAAVALLEAVTWILEGWRRVAHLRAVLRRRHLVEDLCGALEVVGPAFGLPANRAQRAGRVRRNQIGLLTCQRSRLRFVHERVR